MSTPVTWVVVADPQRAAIYAVPRGMARLREILVLEHSVRAGGDDGGRARDDFAAELALNLEEARRDGRFDDLMLVAEAPFLAELRANLSNALRAVLTGEIAKDLVDAGRETLQEEVLKVL